jgi:peptidoglycan/LPS O-acetylase OafA/YrhL
MTTQPPRASLKLKNVGPQDHFRHLDTLRAVAALAVFAYHCHTEFRVNNYYLSPVLNHGNLGVILFYLLSGFVIFGSLERLRQGQLGGSFGSISQKFWVRRVLRVYPLYLFSIVVVIFLDSSVRNSLDLKNILSHMFGVHSFFRNYHGALNGVLWTLSLELQFYLIAPFLYFSFFKAKDKLVLLLSLVLWLGSYFFTRYVLIEKYSLWGTGGGEKIDSWSYFIGLNQLPNILVFFLLGYLAFRRRYQHLKLASLLIPPVLFLLSFQEHRLSLYLAPTCDVYCFNYLRQLLYATGFYFVIRVLTSATCNVNFPKSAEALFEWLGKISFGIYIWHLLIIRFYQQILPHTSNSFNIFVSLCTTIIIADFSYRYIESRFIDLVRR